MAALKNRRFEHVAQALFLMKTPEQASADAGFNTKGSSFASNARKRAQHPLIKARVAELQSQAAAVAIIDAAWIRERVARIADVRHDDDKVKPSDSVAAAALLAKMTPDALVPTKINPTDGDGNDLFPMVEIRFVKPPKKD